MKRFQYGIEKRAAARAIEVLRLQHIDVLSGILASNKKEVTVEPNYLNMPAGMLKLYCYKCGGPIFVFLNGTETPDLPDNATRIIVDRYICGYNKSKKKDYIAHKSCCLRV